MPAYDLVIRGGTLIDPAAGLHARRDVAIAHGKIAAVEETINADGDSRSLDATNKLVVPGLIDLHAHVFKGVGEGADAERDCLQRGTTTIIDGGSTGFRSFVGFKHYVIQPARPRILAWLNISSIGLTDTRVGELLNLLYVDVESAVRTVEANRDTIIGFKARLSGYVAGGSFKPAMKLAREAADAVNLPIMVHIGETFEPLPEALALLKPGDVVTHTLTGRRHGILGYDGQLLPAVREARASGIHFDAAHGRMHFGFDVVRRALDQGFVTDTLSTDITAFTAADPNFHLPHLMSKLMALGLSLDEVIALSTSNASRYLKREGEIGTLRPGASADVSILELEQGNFALRDNEGQTVQAEQVLRPWATILAGDVVEPE